MLKTEDGCSTRERSRDPSRYAARDCGDACAEGNETERLPRHFVQTLETEVKRSFEDDDGDADPDGSGKPEPKIVGTMPSERPCRSNERPAVRLVSNMAVGCQPEEDREWGDVALNQ